MCGRRRVFWSVRFAFRPVGFRALCLLAAPWLLAGCYGPSGGKLGASAELRVVDPARPGGLDRLPTPDVADLLAASRPFRIGPHDVLVIDVFGLPGFEEREVVVDSAGRISVPLAGSLQAAGRTPEELRADLAAALRSNFVRNPEVSVNIKQAASQMVVVDGAVEMPGLYPVTAGMTLTRALASARGLSEMARVDDVVVLRNVAGQRYAGLYNIAAIRRGNYPDPEIFANDTIIVGESRQRQLFRDFLGVVPLLTTPLVVALQN